MATTIYFNGRVTAIPGSYSEVDASGLATVNLGASGIVACIGEAEGGKPATVLSTTNPGKVTKLFRAGDLREAGQILFDPSKDPDIGGGAQEVKFVKVNPATQAALTLPDANGDNAITFTSKDYGAFNNKLQVQVAAGTASGKKVEITDGQATESFDNLGAVEACKLSYAGDFTATVSFDPSTGLTASGTHTVPANTDYAGSVVATREAGAYTTRATLYVEANDNADNAKTVQVWGIANGALATKVTTLVNGASTHIQAPGGHEFTEVFAVQASAPLTGTALFQDSNNDAWGISIGPGQDSFGLHSFTGNGIELDEAGVITATASAGNTAQIVVFGVNNEVELITLNEAVAVAGVQTFTGITGVGLARCPSEAAVTISGRLLNSGDTAQVQSAAGGDNTQTLTIYGLDTNGAVQSESVSLNGNNLVNSTGTWQSVYGVKLSAACAGDVTVKGSTDNVALFTIPAGQTSQGMDVQSLPATLPSSTLAWASAAVDGRAIVIGQNASGAVLELIDFGGAASGTTTAQFTRIDAVATGHFKAGSATLTAQLLDLPVATFATLKDWSSHFETVSDWGFTSSETNLNGTAVTTIDKTSNLSAGSGGNAASLPRLLSAIAEAINGGSSFVSAAVVGELPPANTANPQKLAGGVEGTTLFSHWQAALDQLRDQRINSIVVMTTDPAVHAAVISHCNYMCGPGRSERDAFLGAPSATTLSAAKTLGISMNTRHARLFIQDVSRYNSAGALEQLAPPFTACVAAGMQAGSEVGTSLTFKYLNIVESYGHSTYTIKDNAHELIQGGLCVIEKVPGVGYRWLRNVTTHLIDNNLAYIEGSVNEAVNYAVYNFRTQLEAMVGRKGFSGTVTATASIAVGVLGQLVNQGAITKYQNLTIELANDVMTIDVEIAPSIPVNFIKSTIHLVSNSFSA